MAFSVSIQEPVRQAGPALWCDPRLHARRSVGTESTATAAATLRADQRAAVIARDRRRDREAEPQPVAHFLRREERLEQTRQDIGGNAGAVVAHDESTDSHRATSISIEMRGASHVGDRVERIAEQVDQHLFEPQIVAMRDQFGMIVGEISAACACRCPHRAKRIRPRRPACASATSRRTLRNARARSVRAHCAAARVRRTVSTDW